MSGLRLDRRTLLGAIASTVLASTCSVTGRRSDVRPGASAPPATRNGGRWFMPTEEVEHDATWMCWPSGRDIWGDLLPLVQDDIRRLATTIADFEPVRILAPAAELATLRNTLGTGVEVVEGPVDDLWARDTLPCFLLASDPADSQPLAAGIVQFNGWGNKQRHDADASLARHVAALLGVPVVESGLVGEGGGIEVDGEGTVLAARSSWVNDNRNPGRTEQSIADALVDMLGAERLIWVDGLAGADITDGHIDTLARFADPSTIVLDAPFDDPDDPWSVTAADTRRTLLRAAKLDGGRYDLVDLHQPETWRGDDEAFLASYVNYFVCNGAVIAPSFGDVAADERSAELLAELHPDREIRQITIDGIAAGGGGIHCATQQQPRP